MGQKEIGWSGKDSHLSRDLKGSKEPLCRGEEMEHSRQRKGHMPRTYVGNNIRMFEEPKVRLPSGVVEWLESELWGVKR